MSDVATDKFKNVTESAEEMAGKLHIARSRNDIDVTMYRMRLREEVLSLTNDLAALRAGANELVISYSQSLVTDDDPRKLAAIFLSLRVLTPA